jgi:hypothetical protein
MLSDETLSWTARTIRDAAESIDRSASTMSEAAHRIAMIFEDGYGGNGPRLIEMLEGIREAIDADIPRLSLSLIDDYLIEVRKHAAREAGEETQ